VKVLNLQERRTLNKMSPAATANPSFKMLVWHFLPPSWYIYDILTCFNVILKWTKTTLQLKFWKVTWLWHFEIEACIKIVPYTYTYACGEKII
jgi:hypothetical protein